MDNAFFVYIIYSPAFDLYYKGFTENPSRRLQYHNDGESIYTRHKGPWMMIALFAFLNKKEALIFERKLKKFNHDRLLARINQPDNIVETFDTESL